ncbi:uncharacterized protein IWZ02DRAFT_253104 [Phyllosticta citriasiana]|uniref:uncharacterized protein n=1 Tax=Phyllosticta citriasiana TaxID=595635 RepID=UPI0030FDBB78
MNSLSNYQCSSKTTLENKGLYFLIISTIEPASAFGLACNVFTVVDFSVKVVAKSREMYQNGAAAELDSLRSIVGDLEKSNAELSKSIEVDAGSTILEKEMQALCDDCSKQATKLLVKMNRLQGEKKLTLKNVPKAMKLVWKKDELDEAVRVLESYQARINTRLLIEMRYV